MISGLGTAENEMPNKMNSENLISIGTRIKKKTAGLKNRPDGKQRHHANAMSNANLPCKMFTENKMAKKTSANAPKFAVVSAECTKGRAPLIDKSNTEINVLQSNGMKNVGCSQLPQNDALKVRQFRPLDPTPSLYTDSQRAVRWVVNRVSKMIDNERKKPIFVIPRSWIPTVHNNFCCSKTKKRPRKKKNKKKVRKTAVDLNALARKRARRQYNDVCVVMQELLQNVTSISCDARAAAAENQRKQEADIAKKDIGNSTDINITRKKNQASENIYARLPLAKALEPIKGFMLNECDMKEKENIEQKEMEMIMEENIADYQALINLYDIDIAIKEALSESNEDTDAAIEALKQFKRSSLNCMRLAAVPCLFYTIHRCTLHENETIKLYANQCLEFYEIMFPHSSKKSFQQVFEESAETFKKKNSSIDHVQHLLIEHFVQEGMVPADWLQNNCQ